MLELRPLLELFFSRYGHADQQPFIFFAPGRVNLIGEHTDYNGGYVLPCALQYGTYLLIRKTRDDIVKLASDNEDLYTEIPLDKLLRDKNNAWVNYPLGIFSEFKQLNIPLSGFELFFSGDIPKNAGLASSASIEMVTAFALNTMLKANLEYIDLIQLSRRAENNFAGVNCGIMDQFAVGLGEKDHALFLNCHTLEYKMIPFFLKDFRLIIAHSNKPRELSSSKYNERVAECQLALAYLSQVLPASGLSEISYMQFFKIQERIPDELIRKRARHVISENQRVLNAVSGLLKGDLAQFGALMNASHESLRDNYEVTGFALDTLVEAAQKINGVLGARMTGAGFGGCTVNIVKTDAVENFIQKVGEEYHEKTGLTPTFYLAEVSDGVRQIK